MTANGRALNWVNQDQRHTSSIIIIINISIIIIIIVIINK